MKARAGSERVARGRTRESEGAIMQRTLTGEWGFYDWCMIDEMGMINWGSM